MKKVLFMILMLAPIAAMAQKFGHVNSQEVIQAMPEYNKAKTEIEALAQQYEADLKSMQDEFAKKVKDYEANAKTLPRTSSSVVRPNCRKWTRKSARATKTTSRPLQRHSRTRCR